MIDFIHRLIERANYRECEREAIKEELLKKHPAHHIVTRNGEYATLREVSLLLWEHESFDDVFHPIHDLMVCPDLKNIRFYEFTPELDPREEEVSCKLRAIR